MSGAYQQTSGNGIVKANTLADVHDVFTPIASSAGLAWSGFQLEHYRIPNGASTPEVFFTQHVIGVASGGSFKNKVSVTQTRRSTTKLYQGEALLFPAGMVNKGHEPRDSKILNLYLQPEFVEQAACDLIKGERVEIVPQLKLADIFAEDAARHLLAEVEAGGLCGKLYSESIATALAVRLVKLYSVEQPFVRQYKGGLPKHKLRLTVEFINEHLSEDLSLATLAALCGLSQYHFARAFKQSTGFAPHQYVLQQRIERAKRLLRETNFTVVEISFQLGFADQSHFTKIFRQHTGATPTGFQLQAR